MLQSPSCAHLRKKIKEEEEKIKEEEEKEEEKGREKGREEREGVIEHSETSLCGTPAWMAPELLDMKPYNEKVLDIYIYICVCVCVCVIMYSYMSVCNRTFRDVFVWDSCMDGSRIIGYETI